MHTSLAPDRTDDGVDEGSDAYRAGQWIGWILIVVIVGIFVVHKYWKPPPPK